MDLNDLLAYKPNKRNLESRGDKEQTGPPSKAPRTKLSGESITKSFSSGERSIPNPLSAISVGPEASSSALDLNGISDEEKLRLLQSMDDEDEDAGKGFYGMVFRNESFKLFLQ